MTSILTALGLFKLLRRKKSSAPADDRLDAGRLARLEAMVRQLNDRVNVLETEQHIRAPDSESERPTQPDEMRFTMNGSMDIGCWKCHQRIAVHRGLCRPCHQAFCKRIKAGETTWAELVASGRCQERLPSPELARRMRYVQCGEVP